MDIGIVKSEAQYRDYLNQVDRLIVTDPLADSAEGRRLELLAKLIEDYEKVQFPMSLPDPVEAIMFGRNSDSSRGMAAK